MGWEDGVVEKVYDTAVDTPQFRIPAGTIKISTPRGEKWVTPDQLPIVVKKKEVDPLAKLESMRPKDALEAILKDAATLDSFVLTIWKLITYHGETSIGKNQVKQSVYRLTLSFLKPPMEIEEPMISDIFSRFDADGN